MELMTGIEPVNLFLTKEVLYLLSYISISVDDKGYYNPTSDRMQGPFACIFQEKPQLHFSFAQKGIPE
jgi:hypothetical protein